MLYLWPITFLSKTLYPRVRRFPVQLDKGNEDSGDETGGSGNTDNQMS